MKRTAILCVLFLSVSAAVFGQEEPVKYKKNSRLLVISGSPGSHDDSAEDRPAGDYCYEWKNDRLRLIKFVKRTSEN